MWAFPDSLPYTNRDISWLAFNQRVLEEADDLTVPLLERLRFLGIFSSNLDEFFRVRVALLRRDAALRMRSPLSKEKPEAVLSAVQRIVREQQESFDRVFDQLIQLLAKESVYLRSDTELSDRQVAFVQHYFTHTVRPSLMPIMLSQVAVFPELDDRSLYQMVQLSRKKQADYALIQLPCPALPRFLVLPSVPGTHEVMLLEDVIRLSLPDLFRGHGYDTIKAYTIKLTRDAAIDLEQDALEGYLRTVEKSLLQRRHGQPVRLIYEQKMPTSMVTFLTKKLGLGRHDTLLPLRRRYHNFKDFMGFPVRRSDLYYPPHTPVYHPALGDTPRVWEVLKAKDVLLHYPYHSFSHVLDLLRDAAIDPKVKRISMTLYRLGNPSYVVNALLNAIKNGKEVTVIIELKARFDEAANIQWAKVLTDAGVRVIMGVPSLKVHAKLALIERREKGGLVRYAVLATGNFNEQTAALYTDHALLTADKRLTQDVERLFRFMENPTRFKPFHSLWVSPFGLRTALLKNLNYEIQAAKRGQFAKCVIKVNALTDPKLIAKLMLAAKAGVQVELLVRGMCALVPDPALPIRVIRIVDRFLEHSRIFWFHHGGDEQVWLSSSDWMTRSFDHRIEVAFPVYDPVHRQELMHYVSVHLADTVKSRPFLSGHHPPAVPSTTGIRAQVELVNWVSGRA